MPPDQTTTARLNLAQEKDCALGGAVVSPSTGLVSVGDEARRVAPLVMQVLLVLARAEGRTVSRDDLIDACWDGRIVSDDAVARVVAEVRNLARQFDPPPYAVQTIPKVGFRLQASSTDEAPQGVRTSAWRRFALGGLASLAVILAIVGWAVVAHRASSPDERVEVTAFAPVRPDPDLRRLSDALSDALVRVLTDGGIPTAQHPAPGSDTSAFRIAGALDRDGQRLVATAQILEARTGDVLWSARFDRNAAEATDFQEEVANRVGDTMHCAVGSRRASNRPIDSALFAKFLNACAHRRADDGGAMRFVDVTRRLTEEAPRHSMAFSMHAVAAGMAALALPPGSAEQQTFRELAHASAGRALILDPKNGEAHFAGGIAFLSEHAWLDAERSFLRAEALSPGLSVVRNYRADLLRQVGRHREALALNQRTAGADAFSRAQLSNLATAFASAGDPLRAEDVLKRLELFGPRAAREVRLNIAIWFAAPAAGRGALATLGPGSMPARDIACFDSYLARLENAGAAKVRGLPRDCDDIGLHAMRMLGREGDLDAAYVLAGTRMGELRGQTTLLFRPEMKVFRRDRRFMTLARSLGLVDYWTRSGHWPDFCSEPGLPYDCAALASERRR